MNIVEPDAPPDEQKWYRIQYNYTWYVVEACCRSCATKKLHEYMNIPLPSHISIDRKDILIQKKRI